MSRLLAVPLAALALFVAAPAAAQEVPPVGSVPYRHDGFLLQAQAGPAYLLASNDGATTHGLGFGLHLAVGFSPFPNGVLIAEYLTQEVKGPTTERDGRSKTDDDLSMSFTHYGPALAYYFGESNFYVVGGVGITEMTLGEGFLSVDLDGYGGRFGMGKEWWIDEQWGLGVAANLLVGSVTLDDELFGESDEALTVRSLAVTFTATYQ